MERISYPRRAQRNANCYKMHFQLGIIPAESTKAKTRVALAVRRARFVKIMEKELLELQVDDLEAFMVG